MRAKKSLGQHFLMHTRTAARIAEAAHLTKKDTVLEIGPGTGMLTRELLLRAGKVIALETDHDLIPKLSETFSTELSAETLVLIETDVRMFNPASLSTPYALVANIPYYITGEILRHFLGSAHKPVSATLLVQKEVAERIARSKKESLLSLSVKVYGTPSYVFTVPKGAFIPAPSVDSAVLSIEAIENPFTDPAEETHFFATLRAGFSAKRKRLAKNLEHIASNEVVLRAFSALGLDANVRAEDVPKDTWLTLARMLA